MKRHRGRQYHEKNRRQHQEFKRYNRWMGIIPTIFLVAMILMGTLVYQGRSQSYFIHLVVGLFAFAVIREIFHTWMFSRIKTRIVRPLMELKSGFDQISTGDYSTRIRVKNKGGHVRGEMQELFIAFNEMAMQLETAEDMKNQYEENRKLLVANISHDLKTPITTIQGYLEVMAEGVVEDPEKLSRYLEIMQSNTLYMTRLIDDLFLFSKLDIDQVPFDCAPANAQLFFQDMMEEYAIYFEDKGIRLEYTDDIGSGWRIQVDGKHIHRAIQNVMDNALKYALSSEEPRIDVSLLIELNQQETDAFLQLKIRDYGTGIPEDKIAHIFDRFYRVDTERTKNIGSTGLGLAITRELIRAHGGDVTARNIKEDHGAEFTIKLPVERITDQTE